MDKKDTSPSRKEVELKFRIVAPHPREIIEQLISDEDLGSYRIGVAQTIEICDTYYDTASLALSRAAAVLRARLVDESHRFLTLKRPLSGAPNLQAIHSRTEIEGEPNASTLEEISNALSALGIVNQGFSHDDLLRTGYEGVFQRWGLREAFRGENQRVSRPISDVAGRHVATLSLDTVVFHTPQKRSELFEIEIEAETGAEDSLAGLSSAIQDRFRELIEPSEKSKYQYGLEFVGLEADLRLEAKLCLPDGLSEVLDYLQSARHIADFIVGVSGQYEIVDSYFDTADFRLKTNNCYLRLREMGAQSLLTFRTFKLSDEQAFDTAEIKEEADRKTLTRIARFLRQAEIIDVPEASILSLPQDLSRGFAALGLHKVMNATIDRLLFPISDRDRHFANIKADNVRFTADGETVEYDEVEIAIENANDLIRMQALAYTLMSRFEIIHVSEPKYFVGLNLIRTGSLPDSDRRQQIRFYSRQSMADKGMDVWARLIVKRLETKEEFQYSESSHSVVSGAEQLKKSLELAIERTKKAFNIQIAMALALFVLGLVTIAGSIYVALHTASAPISAIGLATGVTLELLVYFPFRQIMRINGQIVLLTTLADGIRLSFEQIGSDQEQRQKIIEQMWSILKETAT